MLLLLSEVATGSFAASVYIRDGGTGDGSAWDNALDDIPATLARGNTYYFADGTYGGENFNDAESGTTRITLKKATAADHGTETGWVSTYGDGQAVFTAELQFTTGYYTLDGATRNESDWASTTAYGFRFQDRIIARWDANSFFGHNIIIQYCDIGHTFSTTYSASILATGIYIVGDSGTDEVNYTVSRCFIHNVRIPMQTQAIGGLTVEYCWFGPNWDKEVIRGSSTAEDYIIRYNVMKDTCQDNPDDESANGATADIAIWDGTTFDGIYIYGNIIWNTVSIDHSDAAILVGGNGGTWAGSAANDVLVYNNTIVGIAAGSGGAKIQVNGGTGNEARNNLWYNCVGTPTAAGTGLTTSNNGEESSDPFAASGSGNFHLSAAIAGTSLASPYNTDLDGVTRGSDGVFDRGAFEFNGTPVVGSITTTGITASGVRFQ